MKLVTGKDCRTVLKVDGIEVAGFSSGDAVVCGAMPAIRVKDELTIDAEREVDGQTFKVGEFLRERGIDVGSPPEDVPGDDVYVVRPVNKGSGGVSWAWLLRSDLVRCELAHLRRWVDIGLVEIGGATKPMPDSEAGKR